MTSELCLHRLLNTLQIVCSAAPLPSAECQDSALLPRAHILPSVLPQQMHPGPRHPCRQTHNEC